MPSGELTVADIKKLVGSRRKVDVMDTLTQDSSSMSLGQWSKYYETFPRKRILNIISLEFSCTKLDPMVEAPQMVCMEKKLVTLDSSPHSTCATIDTPFLLSLYYRKVEF